MKTAGTILITVFVLLGLYAAGYWMLIKRDLVSSLPTATDDPFQTDGLQGAVKEAFEPARELDIRHNHDSPLRKRLIGSWKTDSNDDFVTISPSFHCEFRLGEFTYDGKVEYERAYAGFFTEFRHGQQTHIFIFRPATGPDREVLPENLADAFIGHDPQPRFRERDYDSRLIKQAEQGGTGQPATRPESTSEGGDKPQPEAEGRSR
jgi:hypothetical protein